jgi:hypothetical protein
MQITSLLSTCICLLFKKKICMHASGCSIFAGALLVGGLYNVFWGKSIEERDDDDLMNKISGPGKAGQDKAADNDPASSQVPDDGAEAKV